MSGREAAKHDLRGTGGALAHSVDRFATWTGTESIQLEVRSTVLYPSHDHRVLTARFVDLENIHRDALRQLLSGYSTLNRSEGTMIGTRQLVRGNAVGSV